MRNKHPLMKLSPEEIHFLRHWMYDEMHYQEGSGPAKQLQRTHHAVSANLAVIIAAAIPDPAEQWAAGVGPPPVEPPTWPWSKAVFEARLAEAHALLESRGQASGEEPRERRAETGKGESGKAAVGDSGIS
jgi:hypothetical protein